MLRILALTVSATLAALLVTVGIVAPRQAASSGVQADPSAAEERASPATTDRRPFPRLPEATAEAAWSEDEADGYVHHDEFQDGEEPLELHIAGREDLGEPEETSETGAAADDYQPTAEDRALLDRGIRFVEELVSAIEDNAGSCDRMADSLERLLLANADLIATAKRFDDEFPDRTQWFAREAERRLTASVERMIEPLQSCMHSERLMTLLTSYAT
jgi:hypothetical protein